MALFARASAASGDQLTGFELIPRIGLDLALNHIPARSIRCRRRHPWYVLIELSRAAESGLRAAARATARRRPRRGPGRRRLIAESGAQRDALWQIREAIVEAQNSMAGSIKHDVSVPVSSVAEFIARAAPRSTSGCPACGRSPSAMSATATSTSTCPARRRRQGAPSWRAGRRSTTSSTTWSRGFTARSAPSTASAS